MSAAFACTGCNRKRWLDRSPEMVALWLSATGWKGPEGPCPTCSNDPVAGLVWSWSAFNWFDTCPERYRAVKVDKEHNEVIGPALIHGDQVHKAFEKSIRDGDGLPDDLAKYFPVVENLRSLKAETETRFALTDDLQLTAYFNKNVWVRVITDVKARVAKHLLLLDWKTGRHKPDAIDQLRLQAAGALFAYPNVEMVTAKFVWLESGGQEDVIRMDIVGALKFMAEMRLRLRPMAASLRTKAYDVRPGWACRFCPVTECRHNRS